MSKVFFVTGTDTDSGKTFACRALLQQAKSQGLRTRAMKPIASGCEQTPDGLRNSDALALIEAMTEHCEYAKVNPFTYNLPIAPHIASIFSGDPIVLSTLTRCLQEHREQSDLVLVEGAGGWRLPVNDNFYLSDWVAQQQLPVILVVGATLGCINHALLTYEAICRDGLQVAGWIMNRIDPGMYHYRENLIALRQRLDAPLLGELPWLGDQVSDERLSDYLDLQSLFHIENRVKEETIT